MFMGEYQHTIDQKGRLIVPAKFRSGLGERFVITKGLDRCLFVYPPEEWSSLEQRLKALPLTNKDARAFVRFFFAGATECDIDKQGRILLPVNLREYASLTKDVTLVGVLTRVEIWSKEIWDKYNEQSNLDHQSIAERMADLGI